MKTDKITKKEQKKLKQLQKKETNQNEERKNIITDDKRFAKAAYDPKFLTPSTKSTKIKIDKRFSKMMTDPSFQISGKSDKYGRQIKKSSRNKELEEYYYLDEEENAEIQDQIQEQVEEDEDEDIEVENQFKDAQDDEQDGIRNWMQNYNEQSSEDEDIPVEELLDQEDEIWSDDEKIIKNENVQITNRLALCNYDWMNICAKDLMILFSSFKPASGFIKSVKVYLSQIGKEMLEKENQHGPQGIWNQENEKQQQNDSKINQKKEQRKSWKKLLENNQNSGKNEVLDNKKLRKYQKQRLRYYYAVIECDSKKTADQIYRECDGNQFQNSNLPFDLRFIPDDTKFDKSMLKEQCNEVPLTGQVKNFVNRALGHSKVNLTWEDPQLSLPASLKKKNWNRLTDQQIQKIDWSMYLNEEDIQDQDRMRQLIGEKKDEIDVIPEWKKESDKRYRNKDDDIEITFGSGFDIKKEPKTQTQFVSLKKQKKSLKDKRREAEIEKSKQRQHLQLLVDDQKDINFQVNLNDPRFKAVYENPLYSIDPVDPKFDHRKSGKVFQQIVKRNKKKNLE